MGDCSELFEETPLSEQPRPSPLGGGAGSWPALGSSGLGENAAPRELWMRVLPLQVKHRPGGPAAPPTSSDTVYLGRTLLYVPNNY